MKYLTIRPVNSDNEILKPVASLSSLFNSISCKIFSKNLPTILPMMKPIRMIIMAMTNLLIKGVIRSITCVAISVNVMGRLEEEGSFKPFCMEYFLNAYMV